jgi:hypothetical protein
MHSRAHRIEPYFVLYLLALLLLLSEPPQAPQQTTAISTEAIPVVEFALSPSELRCVFVDSAGKRSLQVYDSLAELRYSRPLALRSIIAHLDSAEHVLGSAVLLDSVSGTHGTTPVIPFSVEHRPEERRILLRWNFPWQRAPLPPGEHVYRLRLLLRHGTAGTEYGEWLSALLRITVLSAGSAPLTAPASTPTALSTAAPPPAPFLIVVPTPELEVPPYSVWEQELSVYGADVSRDLAAAPEVRTSGAPDGSATVTVRSATSLLLSGIAPREGSVRITIVLSRRDGQRAEAELTVTARPLPSPVMPQELYPELTYTVDPMLRLRGQRVRAELSDGVRLWASSAGTPMSITPQLADTGKRLLLRRWINDRLLDETTALIRDFPPPDVVDVRWLPDQAALIVRTRCFGTVGGEPNRCELRSSVGTVRELYGDRRRRSAEPYGILVEQAFRLDGVPRGSTVEFSVRDRAGRESRRSLSSQR